VHHALRGNSHSLMLAGFSLVDQVCTDCARRSDVGSLLDLTQMLDEIAIPVLRGAFHLPVYDDAFFWSMYFETLRSVAASLDRAKRWTAFRTVLDTPLQIGLIAAFLGHERCIGSAARCLATLVGSDAAATAHIEKRLAERTLWLHGVTPSAVLYDGFFNQYEICQANARSGQSS